MYKRSNPANPVLKPAAISADVDGDKPLDEDERRAKEDEKETNELLDCYRVADEEINKPWKGKDKLAIKNGSNKRNLKSGVGQKVTGRETKSDKDDSDSNSDDSAVAQIDKRAPLHLLF